MLTGKRFRITQPTVGIQLVNGTASVMTVPTDAVITVLSGPNENGRVPDKGIVYVIWEDYTVALFAIDVEMRGIEIRRSDSDSGEPDKSATA